MLFSRRLLEGERRIPRTDSGAAADITPFYYLLSSRSEAPERYGLSLIKLLSLTDMAVDVVVSFPV